MTGEKSWILTDAEQDIWLETFKLTPPISVWKVIGLLRNACCVADPEMA